MSRYMIVCRLRWPAVLLLTGVIALLDQMDPPLLTWGRAWPLYLILFGVLALAERAALASEPQPPSAYSYGAGYPAAGYAPGYPPQAGAYAAPQAPPEPPVQPVSTGIVPAHTEIDLHGNDSAREPRKSWEEEGR